MKSIELNIEKALGTVSKSEVFALEDKAKNGIEMLHKGTGKGNDFLGWLHLPSEITEAHLADLEAAAKQLKDRCEVVVVIGIGGSSALAAEYSFYAVLRTECGVQRLKAAIFEYERTLCYAHFEIFGGVHVLFGE